MSELTRPNFCTAVFPEEYDYIKQFNDAFMEANNFHEGLIIDESCPPPYYLFDAGKVYGLVARIAALEAQLAEARDNARLVEKHLSNILLEAHKTDGVFLSSEKADEIASELWETWKEVAEASA